MKLLIGEAEFGVVFDPFTVTAAAAAEKFCVEKGSSFGVTQETLVDACVSPVRQVIQQAIDKNFLGK